MTTKKHKKDWYLEHWDVVDTIPEGWKVSNVDSPMPYSVFLTDGKSVLKGGKMKILKLNSGNIDEVRRQKGKREKI